MSKPGPLDRLCDIGAGTILFRVLTPKWAHAPLSGAGAAQNGGRFNRPGVEALYLSEDPLTAIEEYRQDMPVITPVTLAAYVAGPFRAVDLTDAAELPAPWADWACPWKLIARVQRKTPPSWLCGDEAVSRRHKAIRFASTRHAGGINLVCYTGLLGQGDLAVYDPNKALPRDQASWG